MKKIKDEISLAGRIEKISMMELRKTPGEVLDSVKLGKVFIITKNGKCIAELQKLPETSKSKDLQKLLEEINKEYIVEIARDGSAKAIPI